MKIHILYEFKAGPWGGGNQFLKALRTEFQSQGVYANNTDEADVIIANANPAMIPTLLRRLPLLRSSANAPAIILRIDGPIGLVRGKDHFIDQLLKQIARRYCDGIIWQSAWSKQASEQLGFAPDSSRVIHNAPDSRVFYPAQKHPGSKPSKVKIIATSWSPGLGKGFDVYQYLDSNLDWSRYEMTFVGNTPVEFANIRVIAPVVSPDLADLLRDHDLYITASRNDPCSNSLLEALACGLPVVIRDSGGHPELAPGAVRFSDQQDVLAAIASGPAVSMTATSPARSLQEVAQEYMAYSSCVRHSGYQPNSRSAKRLQAAALQVAYRGYQLGKIGRKYIGYGR